DRTSRNLRPMRSTPRLSASPDDLPLRPGSRTGGVTDRDVFPRRHHGDEGGLKPLEQLELRIEVNEQTGLWPCLVADREATPRITLEHGVRVIDLSADRVDADEEESARPQQRRDLLQIRPDVRVVPMLEDLDGDHVIEARRGRLECAEVRADKTLRRQCRPPLDQNPQRFSRHIESHQVEAGVEEWQVIAAVPTPDVET